MTTFQTEDWKASRPYRRRSARTCVRQEEGHRCAAALAGNDVNVDEGIEKFSARNTALAPGCSCCRLADGLARARLVGAAAFRSGGEDTFQLLIYR